MWSAQSPRIEPIHRDRYSARMKSNSTLCPGHARRLVSWLCLSLFLVASPNAWAQDPAAHESFRYTEAKHAAGSLTYHGKIPVLIVEGTPEEIGAQIGQLQLNHVVTLQKLLEDYVRFRGWQEIYPYLLRAGGLLELNFPKNHRQEFAAATKQTKVNRDLLTLVNTAFDVVSVFACSTIVAEPSRSTTGELIFGRNLDLPRFANLHEMTLVTVYRPKNKHAFAAIGFPGVFGVISGMNDAGLALAVNEIYDSKDKAPKFNPFGTPKLFLLRRILEECATVDEAEKLLKDATRTGMMAVTLCDKKEAVVFEVTSKNVVRRKAQSGVCLCTNHFCSPELGVREGCFRMERLRASDKVEKLSVEKIGEFLHAANFRDLTMQTMIFEPSRLRLHLAFGQIPSSALPRQTLELGPLFRPR